MVAPATLRCGNTVSANGADGHETEGVLRPAISPFLTMQSSCIEHRLYQVQKSCVFSERRPKITRDRMGVVIGDSEFFERKKSSKMTVTIFAVFDGFLEAL